MVSKKNYLILIRRKSWTYYERMMNSKKWDIFFFGGWTHLITCYQFMWQINIDWQQSFYALLYITEMTESVQWWNKVFRLRSDISIFYSDMFNSNKVFCIRMGAFKNFHKKMYYDAVTSLTVRLCGILYLTIQLRQTSFQQTWNFLFNFNLKVCNWV